jgi:DNA-binding CsgD family transcriptional regulator
MAKRHRRANLNASEKRELWRRWREGHTLAEIGRGLGIDQGPGNVAIRPHFVR